VLNTKLFVALIRACSSGLTAKFQFAALIVLPLVSLPGQAAAQGQQLAPIPAMYVGTWWHHGANITITPGSNDSPAGQAIARWRTYNWCPDSETEQPNPPPCDRFIGNVLAVGGLASLVLQHSEGQDDKQLTGMVTATTDSTAYAWGETIEFTMLPGNMLLETGHDGLSTMYCGDNTDVSQYPPLPCGV